MRVLFLYCYSSNLKELLNISKWNSINANNMSAIFYGCFSLKELSDILNWNIINDKNIYHFFLSILTFLCLTSFIIIR